MTPLEQRQFIVEKRPAAWNTANRREREANTRSLAAIHFADCRKEVMAQAKRKINNVEALTRIYRRIYKGLEKPNGPAKCRFVINAKMYKNGPFSGPAWYWLALAHGFEEKEAKQVWSQFLEIDDPFSSTLFLSASISNKAKGEYDPDLWKD